MTPGLTYSFTIACRNSFGYSVESSVIRIIAASQPDAPILPTTVWNGLNIDINWSAPNNRGSVITNYIIKILSGDLITYQLELTHCDGTQASIVAATFCSVPVTILNASPINLAWGSSVVVSI